MTPSSAHMTLQEAINPHPPELLARHTNIWQALWGLLTIEFPYQTHFLFKSFIYNTSV